MKAGSLTSVISAADAKKMGLKTAPTAEVKPPKAVASKDKPVTTPKVPANKENTDTENKKGPASKTSFKVAGTAAAFASKKGAADDEDDPIASSLNERIKAGSLNSVVPADKKATSKLVASKPATMNAKPKEEKKVEEKKAAPEKPVTKTAEPAKKEAKDRKMSTTEVPKLNSEPKVMKGRKKTDQEPPLEETK